MGTVARKVCKWEVYSCGRDLTYNTDFCLGSCNHGNKHADIPSNKQIHNVDTVSFKYETSVNIMYIIL